jgi:hypothetical protein
MAEVNDAQGTILKYHHPGAPGGAGTTVDKVYSIGPVGLGRELRDVTSLGDTVHKHKLNIPDIPEIAVKVWYDSQDPAHLQIWMFGTTGALITWSVLMEQGSSPFEAVQFTAYVVNPQIDEMTVDGDLTLSFSLKPQSLISEIHQT